MIKWAAKQPGWRPCGVVGWSWRVKDNTAWVCRSSLDVHAAGWTPGTTGDVLHQIAERCPHELIIRTGHVSRVWQACLITNYLLRWNWNYPASADGDLVLFFLFFLQVEWGHYVVALNSRNIIHMIWWPNAGDLSHSALWISAFLSFSGYPAKCLTLIALSELTTFIH